MQKDAEQAAKAAAESGAALCAKHAAALEDVDQWCSGKAGFNFGTARAHAVLRLAVMHLNGRTGSVEPR